MSTMPGLPVEGQDPWGADLNAFLSALEQRVAAAEGRLTTNEADITTLTNRNVLSFVRAFGPDTSTTIPANAWTPIVLDPAGEPWRFFGKHCWEWIPPGDPDYSLSPAGIRCLVEGIYDVVGSVVFNAAQGTGTRAVQVVEVKGPGTGLMALVTSVPIPKSVDTGVLVTGEAYIYAGDIIELQAWSDQNTSTTPNPLSEWLSVTLIAAA